MRKKMGLLIHGYNVNSPNWLEVVWWIKSVSVFIGRLPQGAMIASLMKPELVVFGTGASERKGKVEAEVMRDYLLDNFLELAILPKFSDVNLKELRDRIASVSRLEIKSKNTFEEIKYASYMFKEAGIEIFGSISSPDHVSRCAVNADQIFSEEKELSVFRGNYFTWPSQIPYGVENKWPVVVETPHRLHQFVQKLIGLPKEKQEEIIKKNPD